MEFKLPVLPDYRPACLQSETPLRGIETDYVNFSSFKPRIQLPSQIFRRTGIHPLLREIECWILRICLPVRPCSIFLI